MRTGQRRASATGSGWPSRRSRPDASATRRGSSISAYPSSPTRPRRKPCSLSCSVGRWWRAASASPSWPRRWPPSRWRSPGWPYWRGPSSRGAVLAGRDALFVLVAFALPGATRAARSPGQPVSGGIRPAERDAGVARAGLQRVYETPLARLLSWAVRRGCVSAGWRRGWVRNREAAMAFGTRYDERA